MANQKKDQTELALLLDDTVATYNRYVVFEAAAADAIALWVAHTHVHQCFNTTPYVLVISATKRAGKTRLLELSAELVHQPFEAITPSAASIYREMALHPTIILDEADQTTIKGALLAIFNRGYRQGGYVTRADGRGGVSRFEVFGPKLFAGIAGQRLPLPETLVDRSIVIDLKRKAPHEHVDRFVRNIVAVEAGLIRQRLEIWADAVREDLHGGAPPALPDHLNDRAREGWETLATIAALAGNDWLDRARTAAVALNGGEEEPGDGEALLHDCRGVFNLHREPRVRTADLEHGIPLLPDRQYVGPLDGRTIATILRRFGIRPKALRFGDEVRQGYERADFEDSWLRYLR